MRRDVRGLAAWTVIAAAIAVPGRARAFCRTTTVTPTADFVPFGDQCWTEGKPLYWANACVGYSLQRGASREVAYQDAATAIATAFAKWTGATCPTGGTDATGAPATSRVSVDVRDLGPVDCDLVQYNQDEGNQHVIVFRDDVWPHHDANNTLALTTVTFSPSTGEIYDADMEINTHDQHVSLRDPIAADGYDFASIVTHETGHFLGLAHSGSERATMFAHYQPGTTWMRNLTSDDVAGICSIYAPFGTRSTDSGDVARGACDPTPRHGFASQCGTPDKKGCIPSLAIGARRRGRGDGADARGGLFAMVIALGAVCARRMRRARRR